MNKLHRNIVVNGNSQSINMMGVTDITNPADVMRYNERKKKDHQKYFSFQFGIKTKLLGDCIDYITRKSGLKWLITKIFKDCGCEKRRIYFNKWTIYIPFIFFKSNMSYIPMKVHEKTSMVLDNGNGEQSTPLSRELLRKNKKPCACGQTRL